MESSTSTKFGDSNGNFSSSHHDFEVGDVVIGKVFETKNKRGLILEEAGGRSRKKFRVVFENSVDNWYYPDQLWFANETHDFDRSELYEVSQALRILGVVESIDDNLSESTESSASNEPIIEEIAIEAEMEPVPSTTISENSRRGRGRGRGNVNRTSEIRQTVTNFPTEEDVDLLDVKFGGRNGFIQKWNQVENVVIDNDLGVYIRSAKLQWGKLYGSVIPDGIKPFISYFKLMFPWQELNNIVGFTNDYIALSRRGSPITKGNFITFLGIRLAMSLDRSIGGVEAYFTSKHEEETIFQPPDYHNRFKMSLKEFQKIDQCFRLDEFIDNEVGEDRYKPIRRFFDAMNTRKVDVLNPGQVIVVDECMSSWKGYESYVKHDSVVHVTKIQRKPKNVGIELKASADGETGILLQLEIQEGEEANKHKEFHATPPSAPFHSAITMRLVKPWFGSLRTIVADSAFGSLQTCGYLLSSGLHFLGVVKTCSGGYPMAFYKSWGKTNPQRGQWKTTTTNISVNGIEHTIIAVGWCSKHDMIKTFIGTRSTTLPGTPLVVQRSKQVSVDGIWQRVNESKETTRPKLIEDLFKYFSVIDYHDRLRQGYLQMEINWKTKKWWHRLFATLLSMIFTDCYLAYSYEYDTYVHETEDKLSFYNFMGKMAHALIFNKEDGDSINTRSMIDAGENHKVMVKL